MKIAAIYIRAGHLPNIFGKNHDEITINLGGKNIYKIEKGEIEVLPNRHYIDDLLSKNISLLSCIVGNNGSGKTTMLHEIANGYNHIYVLEDQQGIYELTDNIEHVHRVYYTPYLNHTTSGAVRDNGKDFSKFALIKIDTHGDSGLLSEFLDAHHSENIKRWIQFNYFYREQTFNKITLPVFREVEVRLNHFDSNVRNSGKFNDTSYQLRPVIELIFSKIKDEQIEKEEQAGQRSKLSEDEAKELSYRIRFEYSLYETVLGKIVSILEHAGNDYLNEGYIVGDFEDELSKSTVREAIQWFLENSGVFSGDNRYSFSKHLVVTELIDYVISLVNTESLTDNWRKITISDEQALNIITLYDSFNNSFINQWFKFDFKPMFTFTPDIIVSSGEQSFLNIFSTLYYHAQNIKNKVNIDLHSFDPLSKIGNEILLLLDEGDNAFHPQWKKEYVKNLRQIVPIIYQGYNIQIIITSHDPLTLSDFPKNNVVFLEKTEKATIMGNAEGKRTFGANISDLLKDSFFLSDGQIGSFSADIIDSIINDINSKDLNNERINSIERIISCIDEPVIKFKLAEMLSGAIGDKRFERRLVNDEIQRLTKKRDLI